MVGPALHGGSCTWHYWIAHTSSEWLEPWCWVALAVILPMLFSRQDEQRQVTVETGGAPGAGDAAGPGRAGSGARAAGAARGRTGADRCGNCRTARPSAPIQPSVPVVKPAPAPVAAKPAAPAPAPKPVAPQPAAPGKPGVGKAADPNGLPISWSVQLASLSNRKRRSSAENPAQPGL